VTERRRKSTRSTVSPRASPIRTPVPAPKITSARYRSGTASTRRRTVSADIGTIWRWWTSGSLMSRQGVRAITPSRTAAENTGKSSGYRVGRELVQLPEWVAEVPIGSGEGLVELLFEVVSEADVITGKIQKVKRQTTLQRRERYQQNVRRICTLPLPDGRSYGDMPSCPCSRQYRRTVCLGRPSPTSSSTNSISASNSPLALPSLYAPLTGNLGAGGFVEPSHCFLN
jgi:hypothetical protein